MRMASYQISVVNSTTQATPTNFQQFIQTTLQYPSGVRFWSPTDGWLYGWLESLSSTNQAVIWVKIPSSIPANGVYQIYMVENSSLNFDGVYWGEAPNLSSSYAQYDNGASIFNFYDNFAGTTLSSKWTSSTSSGTIVVNNGINLYTTTGGGSAGISFATAQTTNNVIREAAINLYGSSGTDIRDRVNPRLSGFSSGDFGYFTGDNLTNQTQYFWNSTFLSLSVFTPVFSSATSPLILDSQSYTSTGNFYWNSYNYGNYNSPIFSASATFTAGTTYTTAYAATLDSGGSVESSEYIYFVRIRDYPPNGVMPETAIVPLQAWEVFMPPLP